MKSPVLPLICAALLAGLPAMAQQKAKDHSAHHPAAANAADMSDGEVRKVDKEAGKLTLKHGEIKNLDMPAMTMVFRARPVTLLNGLAPGDVVDFTADKVDGQYVVTALRKLR